ncbi:MAG: ORF6N domain-containing protein [Nitrospirae bacterium]|nr:MAG: ORF6N domain-containing protein [Nitrospirota bacterium]
MKDLIPPERIERAIFLVRGQKVLLDADLALIYDVQTKVLNQAVKRNLRRFPDDFAFQLTVAEFANLKSKIVSSSLQLIDSPTDNLYRSRIVTGSQKHRDPRFLPYAFTEHGAIMAANVLNSHRAVQMSVFVVRAFVKMRGVFADTRDQARKLDALEKELKGRLDVHEATIVTILQRVMDILDPTALSPLKPRRIGFRA